METPKHRRKIVTGRGKERARREAEERRRREAVAPKTTSDGPRSKKSPRRDAVEKESLPRSPASGDGSKE